MEPPILTYSTEWYNIRQNRLGTTDIVTLAGLSPYATPEIVWAQKHGDTVLQPEMVPNSRIWWGHIEEPHIITAGVHEITKRPEWDTKPDPWIRKGLAWYGDKTMASPDAVLTETHCFANDITKRPHWLVEAKVVGESTKSLWREGPPRNVLMQVNAQVHMMGGNTQGCYVAARIAGDPVRIWEIQPHPGMGQFLDDLVEQFWETPTMPDSWAHDIQARLTQIGFLPTPDTVHAKEIGIDEALTLVEWRAAKRGVARAEQLRNDLAEQVRKIVDGFDVLTVNGSAVLTVSNSSRTHLDTGTMFENHPEIQQAMDLYRYKTQHSVMRTTPHLDQASD